MFTKESLKNPSWLILCDFFIHIYRDAWYDLELNLFPTDVTNHYSGFPITT